MAIEDTARNLLSMALNTVDAFSHNEAVHHQFGAKYTDVFWKLVSVVEELHKIDPEPALVDQWNAEAREWREKNPDVVKVIEGLLDESED